MIVGLKAQSDLENPPAKRLVFIVGDGLRDESFHRDGFKRTPFLRSKLLDQAIYAISHTRLPTESRPGHVALLAGLYEDPSAVLKGWQDNPVEFDSVFNRSRFAYAWGSPDILRIFRKSNVELDSYDASSEDFSGKFNTNLLDTWVFERVQVFLTHDIKDNDRTVYFLHLLGLDSAGHIHKPNTQLFDQNLALVDNGIADIVDRFNRKFPDKRTAFVFSSDHGMTDKGSHGAGSDHETVTPFVAWGAGLQLGKHIQSKHTSSIFQLDGVDIHKWSIRQADVAPLLTSLIGVAAPINNVGQLPVHFLNVSDEYKATAIYNNAQQIAAQYKHLQNHYKTGFFFSDFHDLTENDMLSREYKIQSALRSKDFSVAIRSSEEFIELSLKGIDYFQTYYEKLLLFAVAVGMIGWIFFLYQKLDIDVTDDTYQKLNQNQQSRSKWIGLLAVIFGLLTVFVFIQKIDIQTGIFLVLPVLFWIPINTPNMLQVFKHTHTWIWIGGLEICVLTFFHRFFLSALLIGVIAYDFLQMRDKKANIEMFFKWALNSAILAIFPALPVVEKDGKNTLLLLLGTGAWGLKIFYALRQNTNQFKFFNLGVYTVGAINHLLIVYDLDNKHGLSEFKQAISWIVFGLSFALPLMSPNSFRDRLTAILSSLCIPFTMMSLSYEPLFFMTFSSSIYYWVLMVYTLRRQQHSIPDVEHNLGQTIELVDFKRAFISILYILSSLFGTGNIASVSSFDPNWVRCFVATFAPFLMTTLIITKLIIPILLVMCAVTLIISITKAPLDKFFIILLICCDIMCLNFLFLVQNKGSWLEIGTSISHFVIMEVTVLGLCLLQFIAKFLTTWQLNAIFNSGRTRDLSFNDAKVE